MCLFFCVELGLHRTQSPGPRPTSMPSDILVISLLATTYIGRKLGLCPFRGGGAGTPSNTMSREAYLRTKWHLDPCSRLPQYTWDENCGDSAPFYSAINARIASAVLATAIPSVRLSVCLSVRLSHAGIVSKRRHVARCSFHRWIAKLCLVL